MFTIRMGRAMSKTETASFNLRLVEEVNRLKEQRRELLLKLDIARTALECSQSHAFYCTWSQGKGLNPNPDECPACEALKEINANNVRDTSEVSK